MPAIDYLSELDRVNAKKALGPIIQEMTERQLRVALLYVLHGIDIYEAVDSAGAFLEKK
jgi:hypothetical protein